MPVRRTTNVSFFRIAACWVFLRVACAQQQVVGEQQSCNVQFVVDETASSVALSSELVKPLPVQFATSNEQLVEQGLRGSLYASFGTEDCSQAVPTGADLLSALLQGTPLSSGGLSLVDFYPSNITFTAETVGTVVDIWDLGFNMSLSLSEGGSDGFPGELQSISSSGDVFTTSIISPQGESFPFGSYASMNDVIVSANVEGNSVALNVTNFNVTMSVPYESQLNPGIEGLTIYRLLGHLVLRGVAGCDDRSCGPNGRCGVDPDGQPLCECSCGWSGPACDVSSGFCSEYANPYAASLGQENCPVAAAPSVQSPPSPASPVPAAPVPCIGPGGQELCNLPFEMVDGNGRCVCNAGWTGPRCEACETDSACASIYEGRTSVCGTSAVYSPDTVLKSYTCDLQGTGLESTIVPGTFFVTCNTTSPGVDVAVDEGAYCSVNFAMQQYPDNPVTCKTSLCSFVANSTEVNCQTTTCSCDRDCPDLAGVFANIQDRPSIIGCDVSNSTDSDSSKQCTFDIENFFVKLVAPCRTTECRVQGYNFEDGTYRVEQNTWLDPFLASIPLIVLLTLCTWMLIFLVGHRSLYFSRGTADVPGDMGNVAPGTAPAGDNAKALSGADVQCLSFCNLTVTLLGENRRVLLDDVSGEAHVGQVTGIMGPSGSGKTTMISLLSLRSSTSQADMHGSVMLDNVGLKPGHAKIIGYCPQDSFLLPTLTVTETIMYSAILRLPRNTDVETIHDVTQQSISKLRLENVRSSFVGGSGRIRGISGGERRRVSVAMEIVTNPKIVLLDEPTSGLDSSSAKQVVSALKSLAESGCIVMLSLHQPSPAIFNMLDTVFLLAAGRCLYSGPPSSAESYLKAAGLTKPPGDGVAEFMLECASNQTIIENLTTKHGAPKKPSDDVEDIDLGIADAMDGMEGQRDPSATSDLSVTQAATSLGSPPSHQGASIVTEVATLTWRNGLDMIRNPSLLILHWLLALGMGIFAGCVFFQVNLDTSGAQNRAGGLIFALAFFAFTSLTTVDLVFNEKSIVNREVNSGYYRRWTYVVSKLVLDGIFLRFLPILLFSAPFYPMMGLDSDPSSVALFLMTLGTFAVTAGALSLAVTFSSSTAGQASFMMNIILLVSLLNSGFFVNAENMPDWISWLRYLSIFFYGYSVLITSEVANLLFQFVVEGYTAVENVRGVTFLNILGINPYETTHYIIILDCMYAIFCMLALLFSYVAAADLIGWVFRKKTTTRWTSRR